MEGQREGTTEVGQDFIEGLGKFGEISRKDKEHCRIWQELLQKSVQHDSGDLSRWSRMARGIGNVVEGGVWLEESPARLAGGDKGDVSV